MITRAEVDADVAADVRRWAWRCFWSWVAAWFLWGLILGVGSR